MVWIRSLLSIRQTEVRLFEHVCNHSLEAHFSPILRGIDPTDPIIHQFFDFPGNDHSAAAAENPDVLCIVLTEEIDHVAEKFIMPALIRTDGNPLDILLNGDFDDFLHPTVVSEMNYLCSH